MLYLGIGNAGCQILNHFRRQVFGALRLDRPTMRLAVGDADINNSVIHEFAGKKKKDDPNLFDMKPPTGVCKLPLDLFWSGGCGVYHIIGQLLALEADRRNQIDGILNSWVPGNARDGITVFLSAGGGTGGGAGVEIARILNGRWRNPTTRMMVVLPEQDLFALPADTEAPGWLPVSGHDSFQLASAGRLLTKYLSVPGTTDLYLVSNGYLAAPLGDLGYTQAVERLDQYITRFVLLLPSTYRPGGQHGCPVTFGLGYTNWVAPGEPQDFNPDRVALRLVQSALEPLDLTQPEPTGLSALPMGLSKYRANLTKVFVTGKSREETTHGGRLGEEGTLAELEAILALRQTLQVDAWLYHAPAANQGTVTPNTIQEKVGDLLKKVFVNVPVALNLVAIPSTPPQESALLPPKCEFGLVLCLVSPLVEEVYRLIAYYAQSTFEWQGCKVAQVADLIGEAITGDADPMQFLPPPGPNRGETFRIGPPNKPRPCQIGRFGKEVYSSHFWGNYEHLKGKVLQSLRQSEATVNAALLTIDQVFAAFASIREQAWRVRQRQPHPGVH